MKKIFLLFSLFFVCTIIHAQSQWVSQTSGTSAFLTSVYFVSADTGYVCSEGGDVLKTTNGGSNWNQVGTGPGYSLYFHNAQKGFGTNGDNILVTQNGGANWTSCYSNSNAWGLANICFPDKIHGYATAWSNDMGNYIIKTNNGGVLWDTIYKYSHGLSFVLSMFFKDPMNGFIGCDNGNILKTNNGGASWSAIPIDTVNLVAFYSIYFPTPDTGFAVSEMNGVYRTIDGGNSWNHLSFSFPASLYTVWFTDANHGFVGGGNGLGSMNLYQTSNGGNSWTQSLSGTQTLNAIYFVDTLPGYSVGTNGTILKYAHTSGIADNELTNMSIKLFPNPAKDILSIEVPSENVSEHTSISVYSLHGSVLLQQEMKSANSELDISMLSEGVYFIKLSTPQGCVVRKFVKE